jgi:hypothetical protein
MFASRAGDVAAALSMLEESYRIYRNAGIHAGVADIVAESADVLAGAGHAETAARVLSCAEAMHEEFGYFGIWNAKETESLLATITLMSTLLPSRKPGRRARS